MTLAMDTLFPNARIQNAAKIPQSKTIDTNHYGIGSVSGQEYFNYHSGKGGSGKKSIALTALTLLAFMFFLNILQNCLQDQMSLGQSNQVMVISSRLKQPKEADKRKGEQPEGTDVTEDIFDVEEENGKTYLKIAKRILNSNNKGSTESHV